MTTWWRRIEPDLWRFASMPSAQVREAHAAILGALLVASTRAPMVTLTEIQTLLVDLGFRDHMGNEELRAILDHFVDAELVKPFKDYTAPVASLSDGTRRQEAWALSKKGRIVVRAVRSAVSSLDRTLQLPSKLLDAVHDTVHDLIKHSKDDIDRLATDLAQIRAHLDQLVSATGDFYGAVAALVQFDVTDDTVFLSSRERILSALGQFAREAERSLVRVRKVLTELRAIGHARLVERGLRGAGVLDPYGQQAWADEMRQNLDDLDRWFESRGSIERLIDSAAGAIHTLLGELPAEVGRRALPEDLMPSATLMILMVGPSSFDDAGTFLAGLKRHIRRLRRDRPGVAIRHLRPQAPTELARALCADADLTVVSSHAGFDDTKGAWIGDLAHPDRLHLNDFGLLAPGKIGARGGLVWDTCHAGRPWFREALEPHLGHEITHVGVIGQVSYKDSTTIVPAILRELLAPDAPVINPDAVAAAAEAARARTARRLIHTVLGRESHSKASCSAD